MPIDYSKGKIYKIQSSQTNEIYIGSTCKDRLCQRLAKHKNEYSIWFKDNSKRSYISSFEILKHGDANMVLIEIFPCSNKDELHSREEYWRQQYISICVNKNSAFGVDKEKRTLNIKKFVRSDTHKNYNKIYKSSEKYKVYNRNYKKNKYQNSKMVCGICAKVCNKCDYKRHSRSDYHLTKGKIFEQIKNTDNEYKLLISNTLI